jgi:hypothetical protein
MAHAAAISRLHAQAGRAAPDADPVASVPSRIRMLGRRFLARRPRLVAKLQRFSVQHPRLHRLLWTPARLAWRTISLQWPRRRAVRAQRHLPSAAPLMRWARGAWQARRTENSPFRVRRLGSAAAPSMPARADRRIVCVTHVLPYPARAGNEYRIARMLGWLARNGWQVLLVVSPLEDGPHIEERAARAAEMFSDLIVCRRDGTLLHHLTGDGMMLDRLDGGHPRKYAGLLREHAGDQRARHVHKLVRNFCPDRLVELLLHIEKHFDPQVILAEYVFMARPFPLLGTRVRKIIDTIDVFSNKGRKVEAFGIADGARLEPEEESRLLARADLLIAIQPEEAADLRALAPDRPVICVGVDFEVADRKPAPAMAPVVLLVGSDNKLNVKGLRDFLCFAWPLVRREVPDAELRVVGSVGEHIDAWSPRPRPWPRRRPRRRIRGCAPGDQSGRGRHRPQGQDRGSRQPCAADRAVAHRGRGSRRAGAGHVPYRNRLVRIRPARHSPAAGGHGRHRWRSTPGAGGPIHAGPGLCAVGAGAGLSDRSAQS